MPTQSASSVYATTVIPDGGTAAAPSIMFLNSSLSGFFLKSDSVIGVSCGGVEVFNFSSLGGNPVGEMILTDGTAAAPSLGFGGASSNTGLYKFGTDSLGFSADGVNCASYSSSGVWTFPNATTQAGVLTVSPVSNQLVLGTTNTTTISATAPAAPSIYTIPDVGTAANFVLSAGTQTIAGVKTLSAGVCTARTNVASTATIAALAITSSFIKLTGSTATDLQGITAGTDGQILRLWNATGQTLTIRNASASASSGNKITTCTGADITTTGNGFAEFIYDTDASPAVWVCSYVSV